MFLYSTPDYALDLQTGEQLSFADEKVQQCFWNSLADSLIIFDYDDYLVVVNLYAGEQLLNKRIKKHSYISYQTPIITSDSIVMIRYVNLNNIEQLLQDFVSYLNNLLEEERKEQLDIDESRVNQAKKFYTHITDVYSEFKELDSDSESYEKYLEKIKTKIDEAGLVTGKKLMERGFFNLRSDLIKDWLAIDYSYWGGFYTTNHDFMHIEVINGWKNRALDRLHGKELSFYKDFFKSNYPTEYSSMFPE